MNNNKIENNDLLDSLKNNVSLKEITILIFKLRNDCVSVKSISSTIYKYYEENKPSIGRTDDLDDILASLDGYCSSEYILHPSQFKKNG